MIHITDNTDDDHLTLTLTGGTWSGHRNSSHPTRHFSGGGEDGKSAGNPTCVTGVTDLTQVAAAALGEQDMRNGGQS